MFPKFHKPNTIYSRRLWHPEKQNELLRRIVDRVRNSLELRVVLQTAVDEVADLLNLDRCNFFWYFHDTKRVQVVCESASAASKLIIGTEDAGNQTASRLGYYPLTTFGDAAAAIARGEVVISNGMIRVPTAFYAFTRWMTSIPEGYNPSSGAVLGAAANLLVPVNTSESSIGFIACLSDKPRDWSTAEVEFLRSIAQQLEIAISQAQLYEQTQKQAQRERLVNQITAQTRQSFELGVILNGAISQLLTALEVDRCLVHLVEDPTKPGADSSSSKHLYEVCRSPFPVTVDEFDTNGPITRWVIQNRRRVVISDVYQDDRIGPNNQEYQQAQIKSSLVVPVQTKETLYAILYLNQCSHVRYWSKNDQKLAQAVADQLAISVQQAHLYAQTHQQAAESAAQAEHLAATLQELRLAQAQLIQSEKMSSLGRLVAGVSHEINNPINFIYGNIPYVESYVQDLIHLLKAYQQQTTERDAELQALEEQAELDFLLDDLPRILKSMRAGADRIRQIVLSLRNFSRLDEAQRKTVDIHEGIENTLLILQTHLKQDIQIIRRYGNLPPVECYPGQLNQVFLNILLNALEALNNWQGEPKAIAICTDTVPGDETTDERIRIVIRDNGPGIPFEVQPKIFDPFFTTKEVGQGTGLGLTVSYQTIVNQHHGDLKFCSEPGLGTEFTIEIPVKSSSHSKPSQNLQLVIG